VIHDREKRAWLGDHMVLYEKSRAPLDKDRRSC
jgi:hypothetical protein